MGTDLGSSMSSSMTSSELVADSSPSLSDISPNSYLYMAPWQAHCCLPWPHQCCRSTCVHHCPGLQSNQCFKANGSFTSVPSPANIQLKFLDSKLNTIFQHFFCANCALCYLQGQGLATLCIAYMNTAVPIADTSLPVSDISPTATLSTASSGWPPSTLMAPLVPAAGWSLPVSGAWVKHCQWPIFFRHHYRVL